MRRVISAGLTPNAVAEAFGVCAKTACKWVKRFQTEGPGGLTDRSSRPRRLYRPTPASVAERIEVLRRQRWTGKQIAAELKVSTATVSRVLRRLGLNKLKALEPAVPPLSVLIAIFFLDELMTPPLLLALALVLAGIVIERRRDLTRPRGAG